MNANREHLNSWWVRPDLNQRPRHLQCRALPTKLLTPTHWRAPSPYQGFCYSALLLSRSKITQYRQESVFEHQIGHLDRHLRDRAVTLTHRQRTLLLLQYLEFQHIFHQPF